jgi:hypothetical protein
MHRGKGSLQKGSQGVLAGPDWPQHLPWVLLGIRVMPCEDSESGPLVTRRNFVTCNSLVTSEGHVVGTSVREEVCEGGGGR